MRAAILLVASATVATAQTSVVEGRVVSRVGNDPVRRASVSVRRPGQTLTVETNSSGLFRVDGLTPGAYTLVVARTGFLAGAGREFEIGPDARISGIEVVLTPTAVITGRIVDADGDPISGATVRAMNYGFFSGRRTLKAARVVTSDDRGRYRFFDLSPGRYYIQASRLGGPEGMLAAFHPAAPSVETASRVNAESGVEARGVDVVMRAQGLHTARIRVTDGGAPLRLGVPRRPGDLPVIVSVSSQGVATGRTLPIRVEADVMVVRDLAPGPYVVSVMLIENGKRRDVRRQFEITGADLDLSVAILPPVEIVGAVTGIPDASAVTLRFDQSREDLQVAAAWGLGSRPEKDGPFRVTIQPDRYIARVTLPEGYYLKSVWQGEGMLAGQTVDLTRTTESIRVVLGDDGGDIAGVVLDADDRPVKGAQVALEPVAADWPDRLKLLRTDMGGNFRIHDVAPGEYRIFAWTGEEPDETTAVTVRVEAEGDHRVTLRVP